MIKYDLTIKNSKGSTIYIHTGVVSNEGSIILDIPKEDVTGGSIIIEWEVEGGNISNNTS